MAGKWEPVPRMSPEFLARWERLNGHWRLVVTDRWWDNKDSVTTGALTTGPPPGDEWLAKLGYVPVGDTVWETDEGSWQRAVAPAHPRTWRM